jgi:ribonuclease-3
MTNNLIDRIKLLFRKERGLYCSFYSIMGFYPRNIEFYKQALMHKSVGQRNAKGRPMNNERLEFLGDAILDAIVGDIVYRHFEGKREGFLTNTRSKIVQRDTLNRLSREMGIEQLVKSSSHSSAHNSYMGGNAFEALVGAIYLDRGYNACMRFMESRILNQLINIDKVAYKEVNFKSKLIEWSQKNKVKVEFRLKEQGVEQGGSPTFVYTAFMESLEGGTGDGFTKKESQQKAAKITLERLRKEPQFIDSVFAEKTKRTHMEEEPVEQVPTTDATDGFIITSKKDPVEESDKIAGKSKLDKVQNLAVELHSKEEYVEEQPLLFKDEEPAAQPVDETVKDDEFDLSDISHNSKEKTAEDIIAEAEAAAFDDSQA